MHHIRGSSTTAPLPVRAGGVTASFCVSPLLATLLLAFKDKQQMAAAELAAAVGPGSGDSDVLYRTSVRPIG